MGTIYDNELDSYTHELNQMFIFNQLDNTPNSYFESFQILNAWVNGSLDAYRREFANIYLDIMQEAENYFHAIRFFEKYEHQFKQNHSIVLDNLRNLKSFDCRKNKSP